MSYIDCMITTMHLYVCKLCNYLPNWISIVEQSVMVSQNSLQNFLVHGSTYSGVLLLLPNVANNVCTENFMWEVRSIVCCYCMYT